MSYDPGLAARLAEVLAGHDGMLEKKMFGGIGWLLNGHMCVGIYKTLLVLRVGVEVAEVLLKHPHVKEMDITGKVMKGWAMVTPKGYASDEALADYVACAVRFVETLPPKPAG